MDGTVNTSPVTPATGLRFVTADSVPLFDAVEEFLMGTVNSSRVNLVINLRFDKGDSVPISVVAILCWLSPSLLMLLGGWHRKHKRLVS